MAIIRKDTISINAGVTNKGESRPITYPVEVHDCSGQDNDHIFKGTGAPQGGDLRATPSTPPDAVSYPDSTFKPNFDVTPKPPRGNSG
jgi:hypothetical protein